MAICRAEPFHAVVVQPVKAKPRVLAGILTAPVRLCQRVASSHCCTVAVDSMDLARASASPYYQLGAGKRYRARTWLNGYPPSFPRKDTA